MVSKFLRRWEIDIKNATNTPDFELIRCDNHSELLMKFTILEGIYAGQNHTVPPLCTWKTPIWHPNIGMPDGIVCVDTLKPEAWNIKSTFFSIHSSLILLLLEPNPNSPQNLQAGNDFINKPNEFKKIAQMYYNNS
jgi:hypothetical protein